MDKETLLGESGYFREYPIHIVYEFQLLEQFTELQKSSFQDDELNGSKETDDEEWSGMYNFTTQNLQQQ